jgi:hypothetical protein
MPQDIPRAHSIARRRDRRNTHHNRRKPNRLIGKAIPRIRQTKYSGQLAGLVELQTFAPRFPRDLEAGAIPDHSKLSTVPRPSRTARRAVA